MMLNLLITHVSLWKLGNNFIKKLCSFNSTNLFALYIKYLQDEAIQTIPGIRTDRSTMSLPKSSILLWMSRMNNPFHSSGRGECVKVSRKQQGKNRKRCMDRFDRLHSPNSWEFRSELPSFLMRRCSTVRGGEGQGQGEGRDRELRVLF